MIPNSVLLFVRNANNLQNELERNRYLQTKKQIIVVSEQPINFNFSVKYPKIKIKLLSHYCPIDLEKQVLGKISLFITSWRKGCSGFFSSIVMHGIDLSKTMEYAIGTLLRPIFRQQIIMQNAMMVEKPELVITDDQLSSLCWLAEIKTAGMPKVFSKQKTLQLLKTVVWVLFGFFSRLLSPIFIGWLTMAFRSPRIKQCEVAIIGNAYHLRGLSRLWQALRLKGCQLFYLETWPSYLKNRNMIEEINQRVVFESIIKPYQLLYITAKYFWGMGWYIRNMLWNFNREEQEDFFLPVIGDKINRFISLNLPTAILSLIAAESLSLNQNLQSVILPVPNCWGEATMAEVFRRSGIRTMSFVHGMVLDPIDYRSKVDLKIVWSGFDSKILSQYTDDYTIVALKDFKVNINVSRNSIINKGRKKSALLLPSFPLSYEEKFSFLKESLTFIGQYKNRLGIEYIIVKLHPRDKINEFKKILRIINARKQAFCPVEVRMNYDFQCLFQEAAIVICTPSSVMVECLRHGTPFLVFDASYISIGGGHFLSLLPNWMKFKLSKELEFMQCADLTERFIRVNKKMTKVYWENQSAMLNYHELAAMLCEKRKLK